VAATLHVSLAEIPHVDVHRSTLARAPASPKVRQLGEVVDPAEAGSVGGDVRGPWFCHQPLAGFDGRTAEVGRRWPRRQS
jgi:hypothetical protein